MNSSELRNDIFGIVLKPLHFLGNERERGFAYTGNVVDNFNLER